MAKKFATLLNTLSPEAQEEITEQVAVIAAGIPLHELRSARDLSQKTLAETLRVRQPAIAEMEQRADMYISALRSHIEAMGGELEITARFPEGTVEITNFSQL
jgi:ribosome-binding protein aMBF1 (putative translation factor)